MNPIKLAEDRATIAELFSRLLPFPCPDKFVLNLWLNNSDVESVSYGIRETAKKRVTLGDTMTQEYCYRLIPAILGSLRRQRKYLATQSQ